jgi:hypothetical protein
MILFMRHRTSLGWWIYGLILCGGLLWYYQVTSLEQRAAHGEAQAEYALAKRYWVGQIVHQDWAEALKWVHKAADAGLAQAQAALGLLYFEGRGVPQNYGQALYWLRQAATHGSAVAQNQLGLMYAQGQGIPASLETAMSWFTKAAQGGSELASENLALICAAQLHFGRTFITPEGKSLSPVRVQKVDPDGLLVAFVPPHGGLGLAKVGVQSLPAHLQRRFGARHADASRPSSPLAQLGWDVAQR